MPDFSSASRRPSRPAPGASSSHAKRPPRDPDAPKPFRIQKKRLGRIKFIRPDGEFGFIDSDDFREDVFFHWRSWESPQGAGFDHDQYIEFELDDDHFDATGQLRAKVVRPTERPDGKRLTARDATFEIVQHHPRAKRRKPAWRNKPTTE